MNIVKAIAIEAQIWDAQNENDIRTVMADIDSPEFTDQAQRILLKKLIEEILDHPSMVGG